MREGVFEGVREIRIEPGLVEELRALKLVESASQYLDRELGDGLQQRERYVLAHDRGDLQQTLVLRGQPVEARRQYCLHRGRNLDRLDWLCQAISTRLSHQRSRLHQSADGLFQ